MSLQQKTLESYVNLFSQRPSFKFMSEETEIQISRLFRIFQGSKMKLEEYEKIRSLVALKKNQKILKGSEKMFYLLEKYEGFISLEMAQEINLELQKKIRILELRTQIGNFFL